MFIPKIHLLYSPTTSCKHTFNNVEKVLRSGYIPRKFLVIWFLIILVILLAIIPIVEAKPPKRNSTTWTIWSQIIEPFEDSLQWLSPSQCTSKNEEAFEFHEGLILPIQEGSTEMDKLIDSTVVGIALHWVLFVGEEEESTQRHYKFSAYGVLQDTLDKINWNEFRANFNEFMKCFRNPIQVWTFEDSDNGLFDRVLQFLNKVELKKASYAHNSAIEYEHWTRSITTSSWSYAILLSSTSYASKTRVGLLMQNALVFVHAKI